MQSNKEERKKLLYIIEKIVDKRWNTACEAKKYAIFKHIDFYLYSKSKNINEYVDLKTLKPRLQEFFLMMNKRKLIISEKFVFNEVLLDEKCPICLDNIKNPSTTTCGHVYCQICILDMFRTSKKVINDCPMCRKEINLFTLNHGTHKKKEIISDDTSDEIDNNPNKKQKLEN
jgi:hypothetical protein